MRNKKLGVNIDHVATVRNARGEIYPSPLRAALLAEKSGADAALNLEVEIEKVDYKPTADKAIVYFKIGYNLKCHPALILKK